MHEGLVQIYTGDGKGKTTAAVGLAVRASGAGLRTIVLHFMKGAPHGEDRALRRLPRITVRHCGRGCFIRRAPARADIACAGRALAAAHRACSSGRYDIVILDEVNVALRLGLIGLDGVTALIAARPRGVELVLTGRGCPRRLYRHADLVTEMRSVKHPFARGIAARQGIEY